MVLRVYKGPVASCAAPQDPRESQLGTAVIREPPSLAVLCLHFTCIPRYFMDLFESNSLLKKKKLNAFIDDGSLVTLL